MEGVLPIVFLAVILKIPVIFAIWLVWWAARDPSELESPGDGADHTFKRWRRDPTRPRGPRLRGPHGGAAQARPDCPPGGRKRKPLVRPRLAPGMAAHERREHTPAGS